MHCNAKKKNNRLKHFRFILHFNFKNKQFRLNVQKNLLPAGNFQQKAFAIEMIGCGNGLTIDEVRSDKI